MEQYTVTGMTCAACSARVEKAVRGVDGVTDCAVSLLTDSMSVDGSASPQTVIAAVEQAGYSASLKGAKAVDKTEEPAAAHDRNTLRWRLVSSLVLLLPLMYLSMGHTMLGWPLPTGLVNNPLAIGLLQLLFTIAVMVINQRFFVSGWRGLVHRAPNMDTLVALGASAAFGYSVYVLFTMTDALAPGHHAAGMAGLHDLYFESTAMILTLITVGKALEARSKGRTADALRSLMTLAPQTATLVVDGTEKTVPIAQVAVGDVFAVRAGESVPVDGVVLDGTGAVDESALTGESIPVDKAAGDSVSAATINRSGYLRCRATRVGQDTTLSQIIRIMEDASATKAPIAKLADTVSGVFVPVVLAVALLTAVVWLLLGQSVGFAVARGVSVLVISCPCALGLATPVAMLVGSGVAARHGVLFKTAASLEHLGHTSVVVLDKTGTVTVGQPQVTDVLPLVGSETELLTMALALEFRSEHPLARAICEYAVAMGFTAGEVSDFRVLAGNGVSAVYQGKLLVGGHRDFVREYVDVSAAEMSADRLSEEGKTPLCFAYDGRLIGLIAVADDIKEDSTAAIEDMKRLGCRVVMLTGDNKRTAAAVGQQAGVDEVIAGVLPDGKEAVVRRLMEKDRVVMVGDGINDAPALTRAYVGVAIGAGADVAIDAADVVLMNSRLSDVVAAIRLSRATNRNIRENLFWAFVYNMIGIPLAAGVFISLFGWELNPMFGAAAMSLSSVCVVCNALRLNRFRFTPKSIMKTEEVTMEITLNIEGMMCPHCSGRVQTALEALSGVDSAEVSHESGTAVVTLSGDVSEQTLRDAVVAQGYTVL